MPCDPVYPVPTHLCHPPKETSSPLAFTPRPLPQPLATYGHLHGCSCFGNFIYTEGRHLWSSESGLFPSEHLQGSSTPWHVPLYPPFSWLNILVYSGPRLLYLLICCRTSGAAATFRVLEIRPLGTYVYIPLFESLLSNSGVGRRRTPRNQAAGSHGKANVSFLRNRQPVFHFPFPGAKQEGSHFSLASPTLLLFFGFRTAILAGGPMCPEEDPSKDTARDRSALAEAAGNEGLHSPAWGFAHGPTDLNTSTPPAPGSRPSLREALPVPSGDTAQATTPRRAHLLREPSRGAAKWTQLPVPNAPENT